jgi:hypothetical protein
MPEATTQNFRSPVLYLTNFKGDFPASGIIFDFGYLIGTPILLCKRQFILIKIRNRTFEIRNKNLFLRRDKGSFPLQFSGAFSADAGSGIPIINPFIFIEQ